VNRPFIVAEARVYDASSAPSGGGEVRVDAAEAACREPSLTLSLSLWESNCLDGQEES